MLDPLNNLTTPSIGLKNPLKKITLQDSETTHFVHGSMLFTWIVSVGTSLSILLLTGKKTFRTMFLHGKFPLNQHDMSLNPSCSLVNPLRNPHFSLGASVVRENPLGMAFRQLRFSPSWRSVPVMHRPLRCQCRVAPGNKTSGKFWATCVPSSSRPHYKIM